ncbi:hypothetical protein Noda2021_09260 [Candidatus Dependentiae bacterium Noda2021]|nr:hypothetical protein Noda2021_09260 [Candidatus Dependentiae bacterium Noda2021]
MKLLLLLVLFAFTINSGEPENKLVKQTSTDLIEDVNFTIKKSSFLSCWSDASEFVALVKDPDVCKFLFVAEATPEEAEQIASSLKTKLSAAFAFMIPNSVFPRWMIKEKRSNNYIGCITLSAINPTIALLLKQCDQELTGNYLNFGIAIKKSEWHKHYAMQAMKAFLSSIFTSNEYRDIKGIVFCTNPSNKNGLNLVQNPNTQQVKKPFVYHGEINFPQGFCKTLPKACVAHCFTLSKKNFFDIK